MVRDGDLHNVYGHQRIRKVIMEEYPGYIGIWRIFSEVDEQLLSILLGDNEKVEKKENLHIDSSVSTSAVIQEVKVRLGHARRTPHKYT